MTTNAGLQKRLYAEIDQKVALKALGNSNRKLKDVAVDLINASKQPYKEVAAGSYLCRATVKNLVKGKTLNPQSETLERIFRYFEYNVSLDRVALKAKYRNQPKLRR